MSSSRYQNWCIRDDVPELAVAGIVIFILVVAGLFGLVTLYSKFFLSGMATRVVTTGLPIEQIRNVFVQKVAGNTQSSPSLVIMLSLRSLKMSPIDWKPTTAMLGETGGTSECSHS